MTEPKTKRLSRRDAIKILGAAAGASVLANLPTKWSKPQLTSGVLPAYAQTSSPLSILDCTLSVVSGSNPPNQSAWSSTVFVGPTPFVGTVLMKFTLTFVNTSFNHDSPGPQTPNPFVSNRILDSNGQETINSSQTSLDPPENLDTLTADAGAISGSFTVLWEFLDPSQGSGSCSRTVNWISFV